MTWIERTAYPRLPRAAQNCRARQNINGPVNRRFKSRGGGRCERHRHSGAVCTVEHRAQSLERTREGVLGRCAVADDQRRTRAAAEQRHPGQRQSLPFRASNQLDLTRSFF